ncbi:MAG: hypothetical protein K5659_04755 [Lachnospiraceae bacterium]|nr:hypothetical protein [Lachnospiraceae bacterium]
MTKNEINKIISLLTVATLTVSLGACNSNMQSTDNTDNDSTSSNETYTDSSESTDNSIMILSSMSESKDGEHVITADNESADYSNTEITKTGDSEQGDEADFYGDNSAILATNSATLDLREMIITTDGKHANAVFSYGEGTTINIEDSVINTSGNCSGGLMTTGGGTTNATDLTIHTTGNSSAAIRSDRGGGTVNVTGGDYTTDGTGSPVIYSTADITVSDAALTSTSSQGVVVEGQNSVTLNNVDLIADNNTKNSDKSPYYQAVMIYQSMSGDADEGKASFTMNNGSLTNLNGDIFFVNNTVADINLTNVAIANMDDEGIFLRAEAAGWGTEGTNGGNVNLRASNQTIDGDITVDEISSLNLYLADSSSFTGCINSENEGSVYVELDSSSTWTLTGDSYINSLTCDVNSIDLNGYNLFINGEKYVEGSSSTGEEVTFITSSHSSESDSKRPDGNKPEGNAAPSGDKPAGEPPAKPDGEASADLPARENTPMEDGMEPTSKPSVP